MRKRGKTKMIKGIGLSKKYGNQTVFENVNISARPGDFVGIIGKTGCGKSTLLNVISGYEFCDQGEVYFSDKKLRDFNSKKIDHFRNQNIAFLFQSYNLLEDLTVYENLKLSVNFRLDDYEKIDDYLHRLELHHLKNKVVCNLSGGEKQRIAFLRAMIKDFDILLCDEPTGNLDDTNSKLILSTIKEECADKIVIMVTHKKSIANTYFNKVYSYDRKSRLFKLKT